MKFKTIISKPLIAALTLLLASACYRTIEFEFYDDVKLNPRSSKRWKPNKKGIESLLTEVWSSDFLRKNRLTKEEILDNHYGIYRKDNPLAPTRRRACYIKSHQEDKIILNEDLFAHYEWKTRGAEVKFTDIRIKATLIHEFFHDFWYNIVDDPQKLLFSMEGEIFFQELKMVKTKEEQLKFLRRIGFCHPSPENFEPFQKLKSLRKKYDDEKFYGTELYSIIADRVFSGKIVLPKSFKKFYYGILSERTLHKCKI